MDVNLGSALRIGDAPTIATPIVVQSTGTSTVKVSPDIVNVNVNNAPGIASDQLKAEAAQLKNTPFTGWNVDPNAGRNVVGTTQAIEKEANITAPIPNIVVNGDASDSSHGGNIDTQA